MYVTGSTPRSRGWPGFAAERGGVGAGQRDLRESFHEHAIAEAPVLVVERKCAQFTPHREAVEGQLRAER
jgi:hypothetical protein